MRVCACVCTPLCVGKYSKVEKKNCFFFFLCVCVNILNSGRPPQLQSPRRRARPSVVVLIVIDADELAQLQQRLVRPALLL